MEKGIELCGLWGNTDKNGNKYLSGNINATTRILVFPNQHKKEDKHPDYRVVIVPNVKQEKKTTEDVPF